VIPINERIQLCIELESAGGVLDKFFLNRLFDSQVHVKVGKKRKGIRGMIWRFLSDGENKIQGIRFSRHNQTERIAYLCRIFRAEL